MTAAERKRFIDEKCFYALTDAQLDAELDKRNWTKCDVIAIDDTSAFMHKKDKDEFLKLFKDESIKKTTTLHTFCKE